MGLDIGPDSIKTFNDALDTTKTVIWNGPMGVFEFDKFAVGTEVCKELVLFIFVFTVYESVSSYGWHIWLDITCIGMVTCSSA